MRPGAIRARRPGRYAILTEGGRTVVAMTDTEKRLGTLEVRVNNLETWAGPGQADALATGHRVLRADLAKVQKTLDQHGRILVRLATDVGTLNADVATLKTDVATLKTDMADVKGMLAEILRRLPATPA
jgi:hypothetical protein